MAAVTISTVTITLYQMSPPVFIVALPVLVYDSSTLQFKQYH